MVNCIHFSATLFLAISLIPGRVAAEDQSQSTGKKSAPSGENASNPLAAVNNTDLRWQYLDLGSDRNFNDWSIDGAFMAMPSLKIRYELHYAKASLHDTSISDFDTLVLKGIWFPKQGMSESGYRYRVALGLDWITDLGEDDGITGAGSDQLAPFGGIALTFENGLTIIPLLQHFFDISGDDVSITAFRLIGLQSFREKWWLKLDAIIPYNWENETVPAEAEIQLGHNFSSRFAAYVDGLVGLGGNRPFDWGVGLGIRFNY